jgi:hypothetical protein
MAYDSARGVIVLFGGLNSSGYNGETWEWNGTAWTQRIVRGPSPREGHAMAYDAARRVTVLFGGRDGAYNGETWNLSATCEADFNGDGLVNSQDFFDFLAAFFAFAPAADFNHSGAIDSQDFFDFLTAFFAGC